MSLTKKKVIKDATITPGGVFAGEVGYGNNYERIVGTYEPLLPRNIRSKVIRLSDIEITDSYGAMSSTVLAVDYKTGSASLYDVYSPTLGDRVNLSTRKVNGVDFSDAKRIFGYKLNNNPIIFLSFAIGDRNDLIFVEKSLPGNLSAGNASYPGIGFETDYYGNGDIIFSTTKYPGSGNVVEVFYEPK